MNRRSASPVTHLSMRALLFTAVLLLAVGGHAPGQASARTPDGIRTVATVTATGVTATGASAGASTPTPTDDVPVVTSNPFLPDDQDVTTCVGMLQRPGCGSSERGGWHQNLVAIAMMSGLVIVFGRVAWGVRRNRHHAASHADADLT